VKTFVFLNGGKCLSVAVGKKEGLLCCGVFRLLVYRMSCFDGGGADAATWC